MTVQGLADGGARSRYGQLTYTSFDVGAGEVPGAGGWQVKEVAGELTPDEVEHLRSEVATQLGLALGLPAFPTAEEVAALPRRLVYAPAPHRAAAYWHTAPAGTDASGRPGNVFAHVLLDRRPDLDTAWRPIELWRSPDWLTPFNAEQVRAATIPALAHPRPGRAVSRESVVAFLLQPGLWRVGLLAVLLDAVAAALEGGRRVALGVDDVEDAAQWVGAVSFLMSTGSSRTFHFSTLEQALEVQSAWGQGVHLACLPRRELAVLTDADGVVRLDSRQDVDLGSLGGRDHVTSAGDRVVVTPWSVLALASFQDDDVADRALLAVDDFAREVVDRGLRHDWPLAMAALLIPELADVEAEAALVLSRSTPASLRDRHVLERVLAAVERLVGDDAGRAWDCVAPPRREGRTPLQHRVLAVYVARAAGDRRWLLRPGGVPLPADAEVPVDPAVARSVLDPALATLEEVRASLPAAQGAGRRQLVALVVRLVDLLWRYGLVGPGTDGGAAVRGATLGVTRATAVDLLLDPAELPRLLAEVTPIEPAAVAWLVRDAVVTELTTRLAHLPLGARVPAAAFPLLGWSRDWGAAGLPTMILERRDVDPLDAELAVQVATGAVPNPEAWPAHARLGAVVLLGRAADLGVPLADVGAVERIGLDAGELATMVDAFGAAVPVDVLVRALGATPSGPGLDALCDALDALGAQELGATGTLEALVELRRLVGRLGSAGHGSELGAVADQVVAAADHVWASGVGAALADDVAACVETALVVATILERGDGRAGPRPLWQPLLATPLPVDLSLRERMRVRAWVEAGLLSVEAVAAATVRSAPQFPVDALVTPRLEAVALLRSPERVAESFLDGLTRDLLRDLPDDAVTHLAARVAGAVANDLVRAVGHSAAVNDLYRRCERFAETRLRQLSPKGAGRLGSAFARFRWP